MKKLTFNEIDYKVDERFENFAVFKLPSSNVDFCGHLPEEGKETQQFFVQFKNGGCYLYNDVPTETIKQASIADSIGKFLRAEITGKYESKKLDFVIVTPLNLT